VGAAARTMALQNTFEQQTDRFLELYHEIAQRKAA
jgi:hypothetical protein